MKTKTILILAPPGDAHALVVAQRLEQRHNCQAFIWDVARFPSVDKITAHLGSAEEPISLSSVAVGSRALSDFSSIWWRRVRPPRITTTLRSEEERKHCKAQAIAMLRGALSVSPVPVYNDPLCEERASRKLWQLHHARKAGLTVPETIMTNDPEEVRNFYEKLGGQVIFKPFTSRPAPLGGTQLLERRHLRSLGLLANAPVIFQERIDAVRDIRLTVVGDEYFAGESSSHLLDWRLDPSVRWARHRLPASLEGKLQQFMSQIGLALASLDFRLTDSGEYVFLEVNPNGQFLFLEVDDPRLKVSASLADLLFQANRSIQ